MSELRHDPLSKRWVIIAAERSRRPEDFALPAAVETESGFCPFCPGNEDKTPPEIAALRPGGGTANGPGWEVRVIPNKYPALSIEGNLERHGEGLYDRMRGVGAHEVIVESPHHALHIADMEARQLEGVLALSQDRLRDLGRDARFKYVLLFKNHGASPGRPSPTPTCSSSRPRQPRGRSPWSWSRRGPTSTSRSAASSATSSSRRSRRGTGW
jgi:UDPglucose--hexose-1-phosphate uridylyltransferase